MKTHLRNQLTNATCLCDLSLCLLAEPSCAHNQRNFWDSALSEDLGVAEREEIDDGDGILRLGGEVFDALLGWYKGPDLYANNQS
jgi:hypothetical protein